MYVHRRSGLAHQIGDGFDESRRRRELGVQADVYPDPSANSIVVLFDQLL